MKNGHTIITEYVYPPIPDRSMDWSAVLSGYDGGNVDCDTPSRDPIGRGPTELSAIADLLNQLDERNDPFIEMLVKTAAAPWLRGGPDFNTEVNLHANTVAERHAARCEKSGHVWVGTGTGKVVCDECGELQLRGPTKEELK